MTMKIKYLFLLTITAVSAASCSDDKDNSDYAGWLGQKFNQELKWNPDSMAFMRANWQTQQLGNGVSMRQATNIKMWGTQQTITMATYAQDALVTNIYQGTSPAPTSEQAMSSEGVVALNGNFYDTAGKPTTFLMIDGEVLGTTAPAEATGLIGINNDGERWDMSIVPFDASAVETYKNRFTTAIAAGTLLVSGDKTQQIPQTDALAKVESRSIIGIDQSGNIIMATIDGGIEGNAEGVDMAQTAEIAKLMGMKDAVSLAGGNATTLWNSKGGVLNYPSANARFDHDGEQPVGNIVIARQYKMFAGGNGTEADPYLIANATQMKNIANVMEESGNPVFFKMTKDVDMKNVEWKPFNAAAPYKNAISFDGDGHTISNFTHTGSNYPSFAGVLNGTIKNVRFVNASVTANDQHTGIVAGYLGTGGIWGQIDNVSVQGTVTQKNEGNFCGGLVGNQRFGTIRNCWVKVDVMSATSGDRGTGGIVGYQYDGMNLKNEVKDVNTLIANCYYEGTVNAQKCIAGGILGKSENRWGNWTYGNICNATAVYGNEVGSVIGRCYEACLTTGRTHDNYGSRSCKVYRGTTLYKPNINSLFNDGSAHYGAPFKGTASETAKVLKWDTTLWDLSGSTPVLKMFK